MADQPGQPDPAPRAALNLQGTLFDDLPADLKLAQVDRGPILAGASGLLFGTALGTPVALASATLGASLALLAATWGEVVLLDCGCSVHGYQSDISRSFIFGADPTPEQSKVASQVRRGQDIAMAAAKVGAPAGSVDDAVRHAYESWGYGPGYKLPGTPHRTGHGIGMEGQHHRLLDHHAE